MLKFSITFPAAFLALSPFGALAQDADANHCEFYVDGLATKYSYNMGWSRTSLQAELVIRDTSIEGVGLWIRSMDSSTGVESSEEILQPRNTGERGQREVIEYTLSETQPPAYNGHPGFRLQRTVSEFAFFAIQSHSGSKRRLWLSNRGANFRFEDSLRAPVYLVNRGRTSLTWSNQDSPLFAPKKACL